jgi:hypothetical protein
MKRILMAILFSLSLCSVAQANDATTNTGNELVTMCNDDTHHAEDNLWWYCVGFINGIISGHTAILALTDVQPGLKESPAVDERINLYIRLKMMYCIPDDATREQTALVVNKYLRDHPADLNQAASALVYEALHDAWPCTK